MYLAPTSPQVAEDYRFDYKLYTACKDDVKNLCKDVEQGEELECLVRGSLPTAGNEMEHPPIRTLCSTTCAHMAVEAHCVGPNATLTSSSFLLVASRKQSNSFRTASSLECSSFCILPSGTILAALSWYHIYVYACHATLALRRRIAIFMGLDT